MAENMPERILDAASIKELSTRLRDRAEVAVLEPTMPARCDAAHFIEAADALEALFIRADLAVLATTHQRALEALREAREALLVFAAFSDKAERFVEHKATFGGTAIFPVKDFRLSHFRRAVEVVALIDTLRPGDAP